MMCSLVTITWSMLGWGAVASGRHVRAELLHLKKAEVGSEPAEDHFQQSVLLSYECFLPAPQEFTVYDALV